MADKSAYILDPVAFTELAVSTDGFRDAVATCVATIKSEVKTLKDGDLADLSGGQGEQLLNVLKQIDDICDAIQEHSMKIGLIVKQRTDEIADTNKKDVTSTVADNLGKEAAKVAKK